MDEAWSEDDVARCAGEERRPLPLDQQAAFYLGLSAGKLQSMRSEGAGPRFWRHARYVRYDSRPRHVVERIGGVGRQVKLVSPCWPATAVGDRVRELTAKRGARRQRLRLFVLAAI